MCIDQLFAERLLLAQCLIAAALWVQFVVLVKMSLRQKGVVK